VNLGWLDALRSVARDGGWSESSTSTIDVLFVHGDDARRVRVVIGMGGRFAGAWRTLGDGLPSSFTASAEQLARWLREPKQLALFDASPS
jgi:hypothetical protein